MYRIWQGICLSVVIAFCSGCYTWITVLDLFYWSFWNFADVFIMVWGCACGLDIIVGLFFITFCRTCFSMDDLGVQVSVRLFVRSVRPSVCPSIRQHLPCVSCESNSSYSFLLIFLKLCRCFLHGVRMCMWFGYNCWIIFYHFFHFVNLVIFWPQCIDSGYLVCATPHTILYQSFWNFAHIFSMVRRCACGLHIILAFIFVTFSTLRTLSFSDLRFYENVVTVDTLWAQLLIQFYTDLFETLYMFSPLSGDVHMVWI